MSQQNYRSCITAQVSPEEAFDKICRVSEWWAAELTGNTHQAGDRFTVRFGETFVDFVIADAVPARKIVWEVVNSNLHWLSDKTEWNGTRVVWELTPEDGKTVVAMTHEGLVPSVECYENCEAGWNFYVATSLFKFLTENEGLPEGRHRVEAAAAA